MNSYVTFGGVLDFDMACTIGTSFVRSRLDYCNYVYYCLPQMQLNRLQYIQNALAHAVFTVPRSSILKTQHWLKVQERIEYEVISAMYI